jgi:hypothetical protein
MAGFWRQVFFHRHFWYALAWTVAVGIAVCEFACAWHSFDNSPSGGQRRDGNGGHTTIDFGGQYLMGRTLLEGHGRHLYDRRVLREVLRGIYPTQDEDPRARQRIASCLLPLGAGTGPGAALVIAWGQQEQWQPEALKKAAEEKTDAENMMIWIMGTDDPEAPPVLASFLAPLAATDGPQAAALLAAGNQEWTPGRLQHVNQPQVGGPLYPPVNALYLAPLALLPARAAYRVQQAANVLLAFLAGLGVSFLTRRRIWWPTATGVILLYPGFIGSLNLGQNATLALAILVWGWALIARGRPGWGGAVWGLFAFKPVWAMVFFILLVLTRRWRACGLMLAAGAVLGLASLPFVGVESWLQWLHVGKDAAALYNTDTNWVWLSRDLLSIPRRWLLDFGENMPREPMRYPTPYGPSCWWYYLCGAEPIPGWLVPSLAGWALVLAVVELTARLAALRRRQARAVTGPPAAFLLLGAWLSCFHFMYYDVLLTALPVLLLFTEPGRYLEPICLVVTPLAGRDLGARLRAYYGPQLVGGLLPQPPFLQTRFTNVWVVNRMAPTLAVLLLLTQPLVPALGLGNYAGPPWDTFVLMALWLWCGGLWLLAEPEAAEGAAEKPSAGERAGLAPAAVGVALL